MRNAWVDRMLELSTRGPPMPPKQKVFKPKLALPTLDDYSKPAPAWFWDIFPSNYVSPAVSKVNADLLLHLAMKYDYPDKEHLDKVVGWISNGADIGCKGFYRNPSKAKNAKSAYSEGVKVTDAIGIKIF